MRPVFWLQQWSKIGYLTKDRKGQTWMIISSTPAASGCFRLLGICARHFQLRSHPHQLFSMNLCSLSLNLPEISVSTTYEGRDLQLNYASKAPLSQVSAYRPARRQDKIITITEPRKSLQSAFAAARAAPWQRKASHTPTTSSTPRKVCRKALQRLLSLV